jgi:branched-chain amino acid transport system permease protein
VNNSSLNFTVGRSTRVSRIATVFFCVAIVVLLSAPTWCGRGELSMLVEFFYYLALAELWNLLAGYAGVISLGSQGFIGLGGYALFFFTLILGWHPLLALVAAGVVGILIALPGAAVVLRLHGAYLAIATWVLAEVARLGFSEMTSLGAGSGTSLDVEIVRRVQLPFLSRDSVLFLLALVFAILTVGLSYLLLCSKYGLALKSTRDDETSARSSGINSFGLKLGVFVASAAGTTLIGALIYLTKLRISPASAFDINWTSNIIFIVIIGGIGTLEGPIVGTILFFVLRQYLSDLGSWYLIILGALAVVVMLKMPRGLWGAFSYRFDVRLFPTRRHLVLGTSAHVRQSSKNTGGLHAAVSSLESGTRLTDAR